jgi:hypothetical protein
MVTTRYINKHHHHGWAGRRSGGMGFAFFAASPRLPLRKGLTEGGVAMFNKIVLTGW